jgi:adenine-specific DNA-methyltransferase
LQEATIYADPPYAFVHYSRFYHAIETFVLYDYPEMQIKGGKIVKGRYREVRHQSHFSIRSLVPSAFESMFQAVSRTGSNLVLSYSNSGLFKLPEMFDLANSCLEQTYKISVLTTDHTHMTMGRREDRTRDVEEALLIAVRK